MGFNHCGQLGLEYNYERNTPQKLLLDNVKQIFCGDNHSIALTYLNEVYVWGNNNYGQLGVGDNNNRNVPMKLEFTNSETAGFLIFNSKNSSYLVFYYLL